jgi:DNA polymerase-3 subunit delta
MGLPAVAIVGEDSFLQSQALREVIDALPPDVQRTDYDGDTAGLADVLDELQSYSMFGSGKLVVVRNADKFIASHREKLEDYVESPTESATLVLRCASLPTNQRLAKAIDKRGRYVKCEPPKDRDLPGWIIQHGKQAHAVKVAPAAAQVLADLVGGDLGRLDNELAKLALMVENASIDADDVSRTVAFQREQEMWQLTNELTAGRVDAALQRWRRLLQGDNTAEFRATVWLTLWLDKAIKVLALRKQNVKPFAIAKELKIWPASAVDDLVKVVERLGPAGLDRATDLLAELDRRAKSGIGEMSANVERFIVSLA